MNKTIFLITLIMFVIVDNKSFSEEIVTTSNNRKVRLLDNGTWEYCDGPKNNKEEKMSYTEEIIDTITGKKVTTGIKEISLTDDRGKVGVKLYPMYIHAIRTVVLYIKILDADRCIDSNNTINILFKDNSRTTLQGDQGQNCIGNVYLTLYTPFIEDNITLETLKNKEIRAIRIYTILHYIEYKLKEQDSKLLQNIFNELYIKLQKE